MKRDGLERSRQALVGLCHRGLDVPSFARRASDVLRRSVPFDGCCWLTLDPATLLPTSHIALDSVRPQDVPRLAHNEYVEEDVNKLALLARLRPPVGILREATGGRPNASPRYAHVLRPNGFEAELRVALVDERACWGGVALYRRAESGDFEGGEAQLMGELSRILAEGLRRALLVGASTGSVASAGDDAPGLIVLDRRGDIETMTPPARRWLEELLVNSAGEGRLPNVVHAVAYRAQLAARAAAGGMDSVARARLPTASGRWLILHGSILGEPQEGRTAVIIEPAASPQIAPLIAQAYGLSEREGEVARLVMQGLSTREIAAQLWLSPYTVQDHLKAIFEKVGVRSRRELVSQVFLQHYVPRLQTGAPLGADGWFADA